MEINHNCRVKRTYTLPVLEGEFNVVTIKRVTRKTDNTISILVFHRNEGNVGYIYTQSEVDLATLNNKNTVLFAVTNTKQELGVLKIDSRLYDASYSMIKF
jgi:hypothetical protein